MGSIFYDNTKSLIKPNDDVKRAPRGVIGDAATPDEKLEPLYTFVRTKIKNIYDDASMSAEEIAKAKTNNRPAIRSSVEWATAWT